jgi:hypothetical protein
LIALGKDEAITFLRRSSAAGNSLPNASSINGQTTPARSAVLRNPRRAVSGKPSPDLDFSFE